MFDALVAVAHETSQHHSEKYVASVELLMIQERFSSSPEDSQDIGDPGEDEGVGPPEEGGREDAVDGLPEGDERLGGDLGEVEGERGQQAPRLALREHDRLQKEGDFSSPHSQQA